MIIARLKIVNTGETPDEIDFYSVYPKYAAAKAR